MFDLSFLFDVRHGVKKMGRVHDCSYSLRSYQLFFWSDKNDDTLVVHMFLYQIYTDENHFLNGGHTRRHLYETMQDFLEECFTGKSKKFEARVEEKRTSNKQEDITE